MIKTLGDMLYAVITGRPILTTHNEFKDCPNCKSEVSIRDAHTRARLIATGQLKPAEAGRKVLQLDSKGRAEAERAIGQTNKKGWPWLHEGSDQEKLFFGYGHLNRSARR